MTRLLSAALARPLDEEWRASLVRVARAHRWPTSEDPAQLGALVRALSDAYNAPLAPLGRAIASSGPALAARLGFSFTRDVPKAAAAVRELIASGELGAREGPLRILDVGSGLGATTWGVARALAGAGLSSALEVTWTDEDTLALDVAGELARERGNREGDVTLAIHSERKRVSADVAASAAKAWDLILLGQVLSELDPGLEREDRLRRHALLLTSLVAKLAPGGALVVVEPALCERTRHLHALRDAILAAHAASVFAPCLHAAPCPAFLVPGEWCHEDVAVDLPPWLEPVARAAGLRWQGLTFSYLVLRRPGERTLAQLLGAAPGARGRIISDALVTKGKREHFVCGEDGERARLSRLDRDVDEANGAWGSLGRGDLVAIDPPPAANPKKKNRIAAGSHVVLLEPARAAGPVVPPPDRTEPARADAPPPSTSTRPRVEDRN